MKIAKSYFNEKKYEDCRKEVQTIFEFLEYSISDMQDYAITNANMLLGKTYFEEDNLKKQENILNLLLILLKKINIINI